MGARLATTNGAELLAAASSRTVSGTTNNSGDVNFTVPWTAPGNGGGHDESASSATRPRLAKQAINKASEAMRMAGWRAGEARRTGQGAEANVLFCHVPSDSITGSRCSSKGANDACR